MTAEVLAAILSSSVLTALLTGLVEYLMKHKEKSINSQNHKEVKRIQVIENIYRNIQVLSLYDGTQANRQNFVDAIDATTRYINENGLYIDKPLRRITEDLLDYFLSVSLDYVIRDYAVETLHVNKIINYFNK